jgi:hypothetical protein
MRDDISNVFVVKPARFVAAATIRDKIVPPLTKLRDTGPAQRRHRLFAQRIIP